jgi:hypothetical protein
VPDPEFDAYTIRDAESNHSGPVGRPVGKVGTQGDLSPVGTNGLCSENGEIPWVSPKSNGLS